MTPAENQPPRDPVQDHIALIHAEVKERLRSILIQDENSGLLGLGGEREACVDAIVGGGDGFER